MVGRKGTPSGLCCAYNCSNSLKDAIIHTHATLSATRAKAQAMQSSTDSASKRNACTATVVALIIACISSLATLLLANYLYTGISCNASHAKHEAKHAEMQKKTMFERNGRWDSSERIMIAEKNITVVRAHSSDRCYIVPLRLAVDQQQLKQHVELVEEITNTRILESLAGIDAVDFCKNHRVFFMADPQIKATSRRRREAAAVDPLKLKYEERSPRCMDVLLDCADGKIGEIHSCFTWINGVMAMDRECISPTEFKVTLKKPEGRILKIQKEQWEICKERRKEGLRC
ncbi:hypothetical protein L596_019623 [Steinernema carpocapsae]|uniref:Uncharacterized protein n=1 Tax=Steinernema carpocapsae TaxID=34508 RepID=A0A4U5MRW2_STECR|nr:hypothetical protein L596_019623 [Steinernema carpocapsae]